MKYKLGELVQIKYGKDHKKLEDGNIPVYGTGGLMRKVNDFLYSGESVLIPRKGSLNHVMFVTDKFWTVDTMFWTKIDNKKVLPKYLYYCLSKLDLSALNVGSAVPSLTVKILNEINLEIPSLDSQRKVIKKIEPIERKIVLNNQINDNLLKLAKTKFWQIYLLPTDEFKMVPNGWEIASFSKIMTFSNGHNFKSNEMLKKYEPLTYKVFKQGNILIGGGLNELGTKSWIQKGKVTKLNKYVLKKWDLLMAMTDMKNKVAILGNTALMNCSNQYILNQRVGLIRSNNYNGTSPAYLFLLTNSKPFLHSIRSKAHSGVQVNLSSKEIRDTDVIIAPKNVNDGFNTFVKPIFDRIMVNQLENLTLNELKQTLLNRLF